MSSRRRSLLKRNRPRGPDVDAIEALETAEESDFDDLDELEVGEDLEVVENTLRGGVYGSFDEMGPAMDSAVMDEVTDELPADGLWLTGDKLAGMFGNVDPTENEPTEPALPREELLPPMPSPPNYWGTPGMAGRTKGPPTPTPAPTQPVQPVQPVSTATQPGLERRATPEERQLVSATPWIAAIGLSAMVAAAGLSGVLLLAFLLRPKPYEPQVELGAQPPISGPIDAAEGEADPAEPVAEEVEEEPVEEVAAPAPAPRPRPAPEPEPEPELWDAPAAGTPTPAPAPAPAPAPEPEPTKKRGLFGKKKNK